jgi:hypothetical protein
MTIYFPSSTIEIFRRRRIGSSNRFSMSATLTAYSMDIQPETRPERVEMDGARYGTMWTAFVDASVDIKEGDEIHIIDTDKVYSVKGIQEWAGPGLLDHKELILTSQDGNAS